MSDRIRGLLDEKSGIRTFQQALQGSCTDVGGDFIPVLQVRMHFLPHIDRGFPNPLTQFSLYPDPAGSRVDRQRGVQRILIRASVLDVRELGMNLVRIAFVAKIAAHPLVGG